MFNFYPNNSEKLVLFQIYEIYDKEQGTLVKSTIYKD